MGFQHGQTSEALIRMCDKAQATKSTGSCRSTHSQWGNWGYECEENEEDDVMPIVIIADILANAPFKEVWAAIIEDDENSVVTLLITYNNHPWIMISFNWLVIIWGRGIRSKVDVQSLGSRRTLDVYGGWGGGGS